MNGTTDEISGAEAARRAKVSPQTVNRWIDAGELAARDISTGKVRRFRIKPSDLAEFLKKRELG